MMDTDFPIGVGNPLIRESRGVSLIDRLDNDPLSSAGLRFRPERFRKRDSSL